MGNYQNGMVGHVAGRTWPAAARARALTDSTRRKPSESAWSNSPIASIEAFSSEYSECGTLDADAKVTLPLYNVTAIVPVARSAICRTASFATREAKS